MPSSIELTRIAVQYSRDHNCSLNYAFRIIARLSPEMLQEFVRSLDDCRE